MDSTVGFVFLVILVTCSSAREVSRAKRQNAESCVMQDICGWNANRPVPCAVKKPPHRFEDNKEILALLRDECPELFIDKPADYVPDVCCSPADVVAIKDYKQILAKLLHSPCKACVTNAIELFCHLTCA